MRWKFLLPAALCAGFLVSFIQPVSAQVAPSARVDGLPIYAGVGISRYFLDYGTGRYMEGAAAWVGYDIFKGLGVDGSARSIFMNTPLSLTRMQQSTFLGGVHYNFRPIGRVRPFARVGGGVGVIEFPSGNPDYTRDKYSVFAPSAGIDYRIINHVSIRGEYEYQFWQDYHDSNRYLNPQGWTIGAIYSFRSRNPRPHPVYMQ